MVEVESGKRKVPDAGGWEGGGEELISSEDMHWTDDGMYCVLRPQTNSKLCGGTGFGRSKLYSRRVLVYNIYGPVDQVP